MKTKWANIWKGYQGSMDDIKGGISRYAVTSENEMFAESLSAYIHPEYGDEVELPDKIHKFMKELLKD